ncbi:hypothetical protein B0H10DRAFT_1213521 [Mycena sp. CBHHK59/15]|nr:hypothetical protein B0H10DRAFT_1213521 [Mycena sp. CBHHK59/15]
MLSGPCQVYDTSPGALDLSNLLMLFGALCTPRKNSTAYESVTSLVQGKLQRSKIGRCSILSCTLYVFHVLNVFRTALQIHQSHVVFIHRQCLQFSASLTPRFMLFDMPNDQLEDIHIDISRPQLRHHPHGSALPSLTSTSSCLPRRSVTVSSIARWPTLLSPSSTRAFKSLCPASTSAQSAASSRSFLHTRSRIARIVMSLVLGRDNQAG